MKDAQKIQWEAAKLKDLNKWILIVKMDEKVEIARVNREKGCIELLTHDRVYEMETLPNTIFKIILKGGFSLVVMSDKEKAFYDVVIDEGSI